MRAFGGVSSEAALLRGGDRRGERPSRAPRSLEGVPTALDLLTRRSPSSRRLTLDVGAGPQNSVDQHSLPETGRNEGAREKVTL